MKKFLFIVATIFTAFACIAQSDQPVVPRIILTSPVDYQIAQRQTRSDGKLILAGSILMPANQVAPDRLEARLTGTSILGELPGRWEALSCDLHPGNFHCELEETAGGWYRLEVRALRQGKILASISIEHVGVGEILVIAGQSNSANYGEQRQTNHTGLVAAFDGVAWRLAGDPEPGASGNGGSFMPVLGDALVEHFHVPIGLVAQSIGSTSVREWLPCNISFTNVPTITRNVITSGPGEWHSTGRIFANFTARMKQLGLGGFRAVLWHQGESDANQADIGRTLPGALYRQYLERLILESRREIDWDAPWFVAQASYHPGDHGSVDIRAAQKALWESGIAIEGPDTDTLIGNMREKNGTGVHMSAAGLQAHGELWAEKVIPWLDEQLTAIPVHNEIRN